MSNYCVDYKIDIFGKVVAQTTAIDYLLFFQNLTDSNEFKDDENDKDWEMPEMPGKPDKFSDAVKIGMRFNISSGVLALIINLVLLAVGLKEECISWNAIENLKKRMGTEARNKHDEVNVGLTCMKMDGKTSKGCYQMF